MSHWIKPAFLSPEKEVPVRRPAQHITTLAVATAVAGLCIIARPAIGYAATYEELQQQVEDSTAAYEEALANVDQIQGEIGENEEQIAQIEAELPEQRAKAAESLRTLYKMQQSSGGLIDLILSTDNFNDFIATITYLDRIQSKNVSELESLAALEAELQEAKDTLSARKAHASQEVEAARQAQQEALDAREEVRQQAIAQAEAERAEAEAALAQAAADEGNTFTTSSGQEATVTTPKDSTSPAETVADTPVESTQEAEETKTEQPVEEQKPEPVVSERDVFVNKWAPRIDAYLAGSPLGGYGRTFAEAAWDYNVDPRWSPAISCIESSKGAICFKPHNAWGWGSASWGDWDTAIRSHVAGLSAGYGYTISPSAAQMYCPPTWQDWYSSVLSEMNSI